jgi:zinc transport system ATP-binding protein
VQGEAGMPTLAFEERGHRPENAGHQHDHHRHHGAHGHVAVAHDPTALVSARGLEVTRSGRAILQRVDIDIRPGEIVTVIGPNGAGKTTLVRTLLGLERPDRGSIVRQPGLVIG